jgi:hypothetical protein
MAKPLHETVMGAEYVTMLPKEVEWSIVHDKTIDRHKSTKTCFITKIGLNKQIWAKDKL